MPVPLEVADALESDVDVAEAEDVLAEAVLELEEPAVTLNWPDWARMPVFLSSVLMKSIWKAVPASTPSESTV